MRFFTSPNSSDKQVFFKHLEDDTIYIRISSFWDLRDDDPDVLALIKYLFDTKQSHKLVLDLRRNGGGHHDVRRYLFAAFRDFNADQKYVLVNPSTNSASVMMANVLQNYIEDGFRVVGTKCWNTNFAHGQEKYEADLPSIGKWYYTIPTGSVYLTDDGDLLQPDVELFWDAEDYINGVDTYMEWVKRQ